MNKKKLLALLMALVMTLTLVPVTAFAEGDVASVTIGDATTNYTDLYDALNAALNTPGVSNATVTLLADITFAENASWTPVVFNQAHTLTFVGNNKTITNLPGMMFDKQGSGGHHLIMFDVTFESPTAVNTSGNAAVIMGYADCVNELTFTNVHINNATVTASGYAGAFYGFGAGYNNQSDGPVFAEYTITDCSVTGSVITGGSSTGALVGHAAANAWTKVVITNTTVTGNRITGDKATKEGILIGTIGVAQDDQGKQGGVWIEATESGNILAKGQYEVGRIGSSGGTCYFTQGGSYTVNPLLTSDPETGTIEAETGYDAVQNNGTWTIGTEPVAEPTATVTFAENTVTAAIDAGFLKADATEEVTFAPATETGSQISVTFDAAAAAKIAENAGEKSVTLKVEDKNPDANNGEEKTFEITMVDENDNPVFSGAAVAGSATITVPFVVSSGKAPAVYLIVGETRTPVKVDGYTNDTVTFTVEHFSEYGVENAEPVARVGTQNFTSLADAIAAANGNAVTLLADINLTDSIDVDSTVTLDLNGKTITESNAEGTLNASNRFSANAQNVHDYLIGVKYGGNLTIVDNAGGGKITSEKLAVGVKLTTTGETGGSSTNKAVLTVGASGGANNFEISGSGYGISGNGTRHFTDLTVYGGTIKGNGDDSTGIYNPQNGTVTISGGTIEGANSGLEIRAGSLNVTGGTFKCTETTYSVTGNGNGTTTKGAAIAVAQHTTDQQISASIQGATFDVANTAKKVSVQDPNNMGMDDVTVASTVVDDDGAAIPTGYFWKQDTNDMYTLAKAVAEFNGIKYASLEDAIAAISTKTTSTHSNSVSSNKVYATYVANGTITLLADCEGDGLIIGSGSNLTIDFNTHTYTVSGRPVGSNGTETIGLQLLKDSNITFKNGGIYGNNKTGEHLVRLIQNYSNLMLDNMTLGMVGKYYDQSTMSNCNGNIVIKDSTVNAPDFSHLNYTVAQAASSLGTLAFSVGTFSSYTGVSVEVMGDSTINGNVSVDPEDNANAVNNRLTLTSGTLDGDIVMENAASAATVTKADAFTQTAPEGYEWVDNTNGTSTLREKDIKVLGGSLRKRVDNTLPLVNGKYQPVYTETDLRFGFKVKNVENFDRTRSFFTYTIGSDERTVTAGKIDSEGNCNLVLTNIPASAYSTYITVKLTMYTNGSDTPIESEEVTRSVAYVANLLKGDSSWNSYATELLAAAGINQ